MLLNRDITKMYLDSGRSQEQITFLFRANSQKNEKDIDREVKKWLKQFLRRWANTHSKSKFFDKYGDWLDSPFEFETTNTNLQTKNDDNAKTAPKVIYPKRRGPKLKPFDTLSKRTKERLMAKQESYEKMLRSAEKVARLKGNNASAQLLKLLREEKEPWAVESINFLDKFTHSAEIVRSGNSAERSLMLKIRLGLSKRKYEGIAKFVKEQLGVQLLEPWAKIMKHRDQIIPHFSTPNYGKGYLSTEVTVRELVTKDVSRLIELVPVASYLENLSKEKNEYLDCTLHVTAGVDSATGFTHYDQAGLLGKDDSLLSEHFMSLLLETKNGELLWKNPNPQSDTLCRVRSMNWTKETEILSKKMFVDFFKEVDQLNQDAIVVQTADVKLRVNVSGMYSMVDGKVANAVVENRNTHACPLCSKNYDLRLGPSYFHSRLNAVEWLIRHAAKKSVDGHPALAHPEVKAKTRLIANELESHFKANINRPKIGGCGSSNNGNTARRLLDEPDVFAKILGIKPELTSSLRLISNLALSSRRLNPQKVDLLYATMEQQILEEFPFIRQLPPCLHKYSHLGEISKRLPYTMNFVDEQSGERCHKRYKSSRSNLSRKTSPIDNLTDMMKTALAWTDPKFSCLEQAGMNAAKRCKDEKFESLMQEYFIQDTGCAYEMIMDEEDIFEYSSTDSEYSMSDTDEDDKI